MELVETALGLLGLGGDKGTGKPPETRLQSAKDARKLLQELIREDSDGGRSMMRAMVKGMVDGHPPYDDKRRKSEGRSWECNLNFMEGMAIMNRTAVPYYNLFARVPYYAECRTAFQPENPDHENWNARISCRFDELLKRWKGFNWNVQQASYWMRLHGIGFLVPENDYSFRCRSVETGSVLVPKGSPSCLDHRIPYVCIRIPYRITELWSLIKDRETAVKRGVNPDAVELAIKYGMRNQTGANADWWSQPWEKYERILKNSDLTTSFTDGDLVDCFVILVQEFAKNGNSSGKISKFLCTEFQTVTPADFTRMPGEPEKDFLFADPNCYDSYLEGLIPFFRNTGDGTWHSVRGYAMESFKHLEVSNRLKCQMVNRAFIDSSVVLQHPTERDRKRSELSVWGTVVRLPAGVELKPTVVQGGTDGVVVVDRILENHLQSNLGIGAPRSISREDGKGEQPTARHVDYIAANEASIGEGEITIFYQQLDAMYEYQFSRASDTSTPDAESKRFQRECLDDGVPKEALSDMTYVRANRQSGYGSPEMGIMKMNQMQAVVPMLPEDGKQAWLEDYITQAAGPQFTKRYAPREHIPDDQDWEASVENQMIADGREPIIAAGQDDVIHLTSHFQDAQQVLSPTGQALQQQNNSMNGNGQPSVDPATLQKHTIYAQTMAPHVEKHIARLQNDPTRKKEAKLFSDQFKQLAEFGGVLWGELRKANRAIQIQQQQGEQATALSALDQAKVQSVQTQTQLAAQKVQSQIENQKVKTLQSMRLKDLTTAHKIGIDNVTTSHDMNLDSVKTGHDIRMDRTKAAAEIPSDVTD